jgi:hypothetical protein
VLSVTDPYGRVIDFLARSRSFFFQVAPPLYSRGWVDAVQDPLLLRKSGGAGNRTRTSVSVARNSDHETTEVVGLYPEPDKFSPYPHTILISKLILSIHRRLGLSGSLLPSDFPNPHPHARCISCHSHFLWRHLLNLATSTSNYFPHYAVFFTTLLWKYSMYVFFPQCQSPRFISKQNCRQNCSCVYFNLYLC